MKILTETETQELADGILCDDNDRKNIQRLAAQAGLFHKLVKFFSRHTTTARGLTKLLRKHLKGESMIPIKTIEIPPVFTYEEILLDLNNRITLSKTQVIREVGYHGADLELFFKENGNKERYSARDVLIWLGY